MLKYKNLLNIHFCIMQCNDTGIALLVLFFFKLQEEKNQLYPTVH